LVIWDLVTSFGSQWPTEHRPTTLEDIDARILQALEVEPWPPVRTIAEFLKIPASTVHLHLTTSINMKSRYFQSVLVFLMMIWEQNDWRVPTASRRLAGTKETPFSRFNYRRWDTSPPRHAASEYLASRWCRTACPSQKDNCKRKTNADRFLRNSGDRTLLLAPKR
jgi:hypothetical protein